MDVRFQQCFVMEFDYKCKCDPEKKMKKRRADLFVSDLIFHNIPFAEAVDNVRKLVP